MKRILLSLLVLSIFTTVLKAQTTVPDDAFETYLETHDASGNVVSIGDSNSLGDGTDGNNNVPTTKINVVTKLYLGFLGIEDLTGIEDFAALENFTFNENDPALTTVDLTLNSNLKNINISASASLVNFDVSGLSNVTSFAFFTSGVASLDLSSLTSLTQISIGGHGLMTSLNIKSGFNTSIIDFGLNQNPVLSCVIADAGIPALGLSTWNNIQNIIFDETCSQQLTYVPDDNFEAFLEANAMGNGIANDDKVTTTNINTVTSLDVSNESISDLTGIQDFTALTELNASSNTISAVDVSKNTVLEQLFLIDNSLTAIDVSQNTSLKQLWLRQNNLTFLDVSKNTNLEWLIASRNSIQNLDLSLNTNLNVIEIHTNDLRTLNLKNIAPTLTFLAQANPNLTCIEVDNPSVWTTNFSSQIDNTASFSADCSYPTTSVPDSFFENYLETHDRNGNQVTIGHVNSMGNGIANDNKVYTHRINTVTTLNVSGLNISDFTGVEDFRDLELFNLFGGNNVLVSIDLSQNIKLKRISLSLVSTLTNVTLGNLPEVTWLQLGFTNVSTIDISGLPKLDRFVSQLDKLTSLDTSGNPVLKTLELASNSISNLDISASIMLESLSVSSNQLTSLDVSNNPKLKTISLSNNQIKHLDFSNNTKLISLNASNNQLESLNLKNGNNTILPGSYGAGITNYPFDIRNNPSLTCVEVTDLSYANANWTAIDSQTSFNTDCSTVWSVMTNAATTTALLAIPGLDDGDGIITIAEAAAYTGDATGSLDLSGSGITDVEGLQAFTSILKLDVSGNGITDLSPLGSPSFTVIAKSSGKTKTVSKTTTMALEEIVLTNNNFDAVDLSNLPNLKVVKLNDNPDLITLSIKNGNNAAITNFDASNTPNLTCILVDDINASYLNSWTKDSGSTYVANEADCRARVLSVSDFDVSSHISLYPNPVNDVLKINVSNSLEVKSVEVLNMLGKRIVKTLNTEIRFANYNTGIYLLKINTNKGVITKKVIKN